MNRNTIELALPGIVCHHLDPREQFAIRIKPYLQPRWGQVVRGKITKLVLMKNLIVGIRDHRSNPLDHLQGTFVVHTTIRAK